MVQIYISWCRVPAVFVQLTAEDGRPFPSTFPFRMGIYKMVLCAHPNPQHAWHLDRFSRFCMAHESWQTGRRIDRHRDHALVGYRPIVCNNWPHLLRYGLIIIKKQFIMWNIDNVLHALW